MKAKAGAKSRGSRKNKRNRELKKELGKKLLGYSAAAGAVLTIGAGVAEAVAIKTTPGTPVTVGGGGSFNIDFDGDTNDDISFSVFASTFTFFTNYTGVSNSANVNGIGSNKIMATGSAALSLSFSDPINSVLLGSYGAPSASLGRFLYSHIGTNFYGNFLGNRGFLGVGFDISSSTHYGWVDLMLSTDASEITIYAWGYETDPGTGIPAGVGSEGSGGEPVPEPATLATLAMGAAGLYALRRNRKRKGVGAAAQEAHQSA